MHEPGVLVGTVTTFANRLFAEVWMKGLFPELAEGEMQAEVVRGRSRFDFRIGKLLVEVKSVTFARGRAAFFPDAVTARGARHCLELAELSRAGVPPRSCLWRNGMTWIRSLQPQTWIRPSQAR